MTCYCCGIDYGFTATVGCTGGSTTACIRKNRFKVGDEVVSMDLGHYNITTTGWSGTVLKIFDSPRKDGDDIRVGGKTYLGYKEFDVDSKYFELVNPSKKTIMRSECCEATEEVFGGLHEFAKNLVLSADEKLLRKYNLKDRCGEYTKEAMEIVIAKLVEDNKAYLLTIAKAKEADEKKK